MSRDGNADDLFNELRDRYSQRDVVTLERQRPDEQIRERDRDVFAADVDRRLGDEFAELSSEIGEVKVVPDLSPDARLHARRYAAELVGSVRRLHFSMGEGCRVVSLPYDEEWSNGSGMAFGGRFDGHVFSLGREGQSAAGLGFYLSADRPLDVAITPQGTYSYNCAVLSPEVRDFISRGGVAMTVFADGHPQPVVHRQVTLWNVRGALLPDGPQGKMFQGVKGKGTLATAASPTLPWGFGPITLAPVLCTLRPGSRLLVWVWTWQLDVANHGVWSSISMHLPAVTVCASPARPGPN